MFPWLNCVHRLGRSGILASSHRFPDIRNSKFVTLKIQVRLVMYNIRNGAIKCQIPEFLSDDNSYDCSVSHHLR